MRIVSVLTGESYEWPGLDSPKVSKRKFKHRTKNCPVKNCNLCALLEVARRRSKED